MFLHVYFSLLGKNTAFAEILYNISLQFVQQLRLDQLKYVYCGRYLRKAQWWSIGTKHCQVTPTHEGLQISLCTVKVQLYVCEKCMRFLKIWPLNKFMRFYLCIFVTQVSLIKKE